MHAVANSLNDLGGGLRGAAHKGAPARDVGAGDVELDAGAPRRKLLDLLDGGDVLLVGVAGSLQDHAAAAALELAKIGATGVEHAGDAGVGEADGVHHAGWYLAHAGLGVAEPGLGGAPLRRDGAKTRHVEEALELPAEAKRA